MTSIGEYAFSGCEGLTLVTIPNSVTSIGRHAFRGCESLTSVTIPNSVTSIGGSAFYGCTGLTNFKGKFASEDHRCLIVDGVLIAFAPKDVDKYTIPNSVTSIGENALALSYWLTSIEIPNTVTSIGDYAFGNCFRLTSIEIPNSVTSISSNAFYGCSALVSVTIPNSVVSIGAYNPFAGCTGLSNFSGKFASEDHRCLIVDGRLVAFAPKDMDRYTIPSSVTSIGSYAFDNCKSLTSVTIPNSVISIGHMAFASCNGLISVTIPGSVTSIDSYVFGYCNNLSSLIVKAVEPPFCEEYVFNNTKISTIYVPTASVEKYNSKQPWNEYHIEGGAENM